MISGSNLGRLRGSMGHPPVLQACVARLKRLQATAHVRPSGRALVPSCTRPGPHGGGIGRLRAVVTADPPAEPALTEQRGPKPRAKVSSDSGSYFSEGNREGRPHPRTFLVALCWRLQGRLPTWPGGSHGSLTCEWPRAPHSVPTLRCGSLRVRGRGVMLVSTAPGSAAGHQGSG